MGSSSIAPTYFPILLKSTADLLANENGDSCTNRNEAQSSAANKNKHVHNSANKNYDEHIKANDKIDSYITANNVAEASLNNIWTSDESSENDLSLKSANSSAKLNFEFDVKLQKLSKNNIHKISDKKNCLSLNDNDSTKHNLKSNRNVLNRSEDKIIECTAAQNLSAENKFFNNLQVHLHKKCSQGNRKSAI